jgi:hypothetical protein
VFGTYGADFVGNQRVSGGQRWAVMVDERVNAICNAVAGQHSMDLGKSRHEVVARFVGCDITEDLSHVEATLGLDMFLIQACLIETATCLMNKPSKEEYLEL